MLAVAAFNIPCTGSPGARGRSSPCRSRPCTAFNTPGTGSSGALARHRSCLRPSNELRLGPRGAVVPVPAPAPRVQHALSNQQASSAAAGLPIRSCTSAQTTQTPLCLQYQTISVLFNKFVSRQIFLVEETNYFFFGACAGRPNEKARRMCGKWEGGLPANGNLVSFLSSKMSLVLSVRLEVGAPSGRCPE